MADNALALTTFASGPDDNYAVVDVYGKTDSIVVNDSTDPVSSSVDGESLGLTPETPAISDTPYPEPVQVREALNNRLANNDTGILSQVRSMSDSVKDTLKLNPNLKNNVGVVVNGIKGVVAGKNIKDAIAVAASVDRMSGGSYKTVFNDVSAVSGMVAGLATAGSSLGLPGTFTTFSKSVTDKNVLLGAAREVLPNAIASNNSDMFIEVANSSVGKDVGKLLPGATGSFIKQFKLPYGLTQNAYSAYYKRLSGAFDNINSLWRKRQRNNTDVISGVSTNNNRDILRLMEAKAYEDYVPLPTVTDGIISGPTLPHTEDEKFMLLMKKFEVSTVTEELSKSTPLLNVTPDESFSDYLVT
jgi:hypothetical protein